MTLRVRPLNTKLDPPAVPVPANLPKTVDKAKVAAESAKIKVLKIEDIVVGSGRQIFPGASVTVHYVGTLPDGFMFATSYKDNGEPYTFTYDPKEPAVIIGWMEGLEGMKVGGRRKLTIPADLAYGANPQPGSPIPPNAALIFDVQLMFVGGQP
ncbi:MAG: FKBP-type peptidyl-prolyl cis-trans isomerase [Armatimonadetes bacterium]|nr:FKBP-type peptidyl-prolyl cis-trans isomerase [Armatimonadota bacterium]